MTFDYTTLKIIYQDRDAFEINHGFDTFLKDCVYDLDYPAGGQFTYLVSIDGKLVFHHTSIVVGRNVIEDDDPTFHDDSVEADMVYRYFYNLPLIPADYAQIAKMLLTSETPEALEVL